MKITGEAFVTVQKLRTAVAAAAPDQRQVDVYLTPRQVAALLRWIDRAQKQP